MGETIFIDCKPWYMRKRKDDTCLCTSCEDFRLAKQAVTNNVKFLDKPYGSRLIIGRFMSAALSTIRYIRERKRVNNMGYIFLWKDLAAEDLRSLRAVFRILIVFSLEVGCLTDSQTRCHTQQSEHDRCIRH
jgi:hypothetical protein